eukprot:6254386-Heterocapsa_arctica.AAC.1
MMRRRPRAKLREGERIGLSLDGGHGLPSSAAPDSFERGPSARKIIRGPAVPEDMWRARERETE